MAEMEKIESLPMRPMANILISWNPNTQEIKYQSGGLTIVEEVGLLSWLTHMRLNQNKVGVGQSNIVVPPIAFGKQ